MYKNCTRFLTLVLAINFIFTNLSAQDGTPDASFGNNGRVFNPELGTFDFTFMGNAKLLATQDGKLLYLNSIDFNLEIIRYFQNGNIDGSFGNGGKLVTNYGAGGELLDALMQPDGKIVYLTSYFLGRINQDGTVDSSFGEWGRIRPQFEPKGLALQQDGKILVTGYIYTPDNLSAVERHLSNGALDTSWDGDGVATMNIFINSSESATGVAVQTDGKVVVGSIGSFKLQNSNETDLDGGLFRLNTDGSPDLSFDGDGKMLFTNPQADFSSGLVAIQADGKILLAGTRHLTAFVSEFAVYRVLSNGSPDTGFGSGGESIIKVSEMDRLTSMNLQMDGKILLGGYYFCNSAECMARYGDANYLTNEGNFLLARLLPSGAADPSLNGNGKMSIDVAQTRERMGAITGVGTKLILAGHSTPRTGKQRASMVKLNNSSTLVNSSPVTLETHRAIPGKIEAEDWSRMGGVQAETTSDAGGGLNVGWIDYGDYIEYDIDVTTPGYYRVEYRVATPNPNGSFEARLKQNSAPYMYLQVPNTGSYQGWTTISETMYFSGGKQTFRVHSSGGPFNINWINFVSIIEFVQIPGRIEGENYFNSSIVQGEATSDVGGGFNVGWIDYDEALFYRMNVLQAGMYNVSFRLATPNSNASFIYQAGQRQGSRYSLSPTGGWQNWTTVTLPMFLDAGQQTLTIRSQGGGGFNINWIDFSLQQMTTKAIPMQVNVEQTQKAGIFPNPVQDQFTLTLDNSYAGNFKAQVINTSGMVYKEFNLNKPQGAFQARLTIAGLPAGEYFLRLSGNGWTHTQKIIKR
jgi:uncharacterized delta-60 repeat protein